MRKEDVVQALTLAYTGSEQNDMRPLVALLSPDFVFDLTDSLPYGGIYHGPDEYVAFWREVGKLWEYFHYELHEVVVTKDHAFVPVRAHALATNGLHLNNEHLFHFKLKNWKIVFGRLYVDSARGRDIFAGNEPKKYPPVDLSAQLAEMRLPVRIV